MNEAYLNGVSLPWTGVNPKNIRQEIRDIEQEIRYAAYHLVTRAVVINSKNNFGAGHDILNGIVARLLRVSANEVASAKEDVADESSGGDGVKRDNWLIYGLTGTYEDRLKNLSPHEILKGVREAAQHLDKTLKNEPCHARENIKARPYLNELREQEKLLTRKVARLMRLRSALKVPTVRATSSHYSQPTAAQSMDL